MGEYGAEYAGVAATDRARIRSDLLNQLAGKAGLSPQDVSSQLSDLLPNLVDKLTPNGKIEAGPLEQLLKLVQGK